MQARQATQCRHQYASRHGDVALEGAASADARARSSSASCSARWPPFLWLRGKPHTRAHPSRKCPYHQDMQPQAFTRMNLVCSGSMYTICCGPPSAHAQHSLKQHMSWGRPSGGRQLQGQDAPDGHFSVNGLHGNVVCKDAEGSLLGCLFRRDPAQRWSGRRVMECALFCASAGASPRQGGSFSSPGRSGNSLPPLSPRQLSSTPPLLSARSRCGVVVVFPCGSVCIGVLKCLDCQGPRVCAQGTCCCMRSAHGPCPLLTCTHTISISSWPVSSTSPELGACPFKAGCLSLPADSFMRARNHR